MSRFLAYLGRFALIVLGYACAALAASAFFHLLLAAGVGPFEEDMRDMARLAVVFSTAVAAALIAYYAFFPAFVFFVLAEMFEWRGWLPHTLGGAVAAAGAIFLQGGAYSRAGLLETALIACGMVGGLAYWLVAGRSAGVLWRDRAEPEG